MQISNNCVTRSFQKGLDLTHEAISKNENLMKVSKITFKIIDFVSMLTGKITTAFKMLSARLKDTADVIEGFCLVGRVKELACPDKGEYFLRKSTWQKCADRIFLTAASVFKTINIGVKFSLISLGRAAKFAFGNVPVMRLIPDSLVAISSFFSVWDNKNVSQKTSQKLALANSKVEKWANRPNQVAAVRSGDSEAVFNLKIDYQIKSALLEREIHGLDPASRSKEIAKKTAVLNKYQDRLELIAKNNHAVLADELAKPDIALKQKNWSLEYSNQKFNQNKAWLGIAASAAKIFVITMATTTTAMGLCTAPWTLSVMAVGIAVESIGLTKALYETAKPQELPKKAIAA
jgi:hypothetical protein